MCTDLEEYVVVADVEVGLHLQVVHPDEAGVAPLHHQGVHFARIVLLASHLDKGGRSTNLNHIGNKRFKVKLALNVRLRC